MDIINFHGKRNEFHDLLVRIEGEKIFPYKLSILGGWLRHHQANKTKLPSNGVSWFYIVNSISLIYKFS